MWLLFLQRRISLFPSISFYLLLDLPSPFSVNLLPFFSCSLCVCGCSPPLSSISAGEAQRCLLYFVRQVFYNSISQSFFYPNDIIILFDIVLRLLANTAEEETGVCLLLRCSCFFLCPLCFVFFFSCFFFFFVCSFVSCFLRASFSCPIFLMMFLISLFASLLSLISLLLSFCWIIFKVSSLFSLGPTIHSGVTNKKRSGTLSLRSPRTLPTLKLPMPRKPFSRTMLMFCERLRSHRLASKRANVICRKWIDQLFVYFASLLETRQKTQRRGQKLRQPNCWQSREDGKGAKEREENTKAKKRKGRGRRGEGRSSTTESEKEAEESGRKPTTNQWNGGQNSTDKKRYESNTEGNTSTLKAKKWWRGKPQRGTMIPSREKGRRICNEAEQKAE